MIMMSSLALTQTSLALRGSRWLCCSALLSQHVVLRLSKIPAPLSHHQIMSSRPLTSSSSLLRSGEEGAPHFRRSSVKHPLADKLSSAGSLTDFHGHKDDKNTSYSLPHPIWSQEEVESVQITHTPPMDRVEKAAYYSVQALRLLFDLFSGYSWGKMMNSLDERKWLIRFIFLETVAGVPGMIGAMTRHLKSLRYMQRDYGWIHTLLEEAENERMHLLTFLELRRPGPLFKAMVVCGQGVFVTFFWIAYFISSRFCHRFVGYLEEEAVVTYTHCLKSMDAGELPMWSNLPAPLIAATYWKLGKNAMMRDVLLAIRADEAHHRVVNHTLSGINPSDNNPYGPGR